MYTAKGRRKTRVEKRQRNGCLLTAKRRQFVLKVALKKLGHKIELNLVPRSLSYSLAERERCTTRREPWEQN